MDATQTSVLIGSVSAAVGGLLTLATTKGIDAWLKYKADARTDEIREEAKEETDLRFIIGRQDAEIAALRIELREIHLQHNNCEKKHTALETEFKVRMEFMAKRVDKVEADVKEQKGEA